MSSSLRGQNGGRAKFAVICTAKMDVELLKSVLTHDFLLVAKPDLSKLLTATDDLTSFHSPFISQAPPDPDALDQFMEAIQHHATLSRRAFIVLDATTAKYKHTCQIATDGRSDEEAVGLYAAFRCHLGSVRDGVEAVEGVAQLAPMRRVRDLRNEAAMVGGVWETQRVDAFRARPKRIDVSEYRVHENWDEYSGPANPYTDIPYYPVFQTVKIGLETINAFLKETYDQDWGDTYEDDEEDEDDEKHAILGVAFVKSITAPPFHSGKATAPLESAPDAPPALLGASAIDCDAVVRSRFPAAGSEMNYNRFIIMDEFTADTKTVIIAANNEVGGQLLLSRCDWKGALISLVSMEDTGLTMERQCNEAVTQDSGVIHGP